jgi:phage terminase large subunit-like protein
MGQEFSGERRTGERYSKRSCDLGRALRDGHPPGNGDTVVKVARRMAEHDTSSPVGDDKCVGALLICLALATLIPIWSVGTLPLQDLPNHLLKVDLLHRYLQADAPTRAIYELNLTPFSNWTCYAVLFLVTPLLGMSAAAKCFVSAYLLLLPAAAYAWLRRVNRRNTVLALAVPMLGHNLFLAKGNLNFCLGLALYLVALACFEAAPRRRTTLLFGSVATAVYFTHGIVFLALVGVVVLRLLVDFTPLRGRRALGLLPGTLCLAGTAITTSVHGSLLQIELGAPDLALLPDARLWLFGAQTSPALALVWGAVLLAALGFSLAAMFSGRQRDWFAQGGFWMITAAALSAIYSVAPPDVADWSHLQPRFVPLAVLTLLGGLHLPAHTGLRRLAMLLLCTATLLNLPATQRNYATGSAQVDAYLASLGSIESGAAVLPLYFGDAAEPTRPTLHAWAYHLMRHGGWAPHVQHAQQMRTARLLYPILYRLAPWTPPETNPALQSPLAQRAAGCYDYVIMWAATAPSMEALQPYFERTGDSGGVQVWRNRRGVRAATPVSAAACRAEDET